MPISPALCRPPALSPSCSSSEELTNTPRASSNHSKLALNSEQFRKAANWVVLTMSCTMRN